LRQSAHHAISAALAGVIQSVAWIDYNKNARLSRFDPASEPAHRRPAPCLPELSRLPVGRFYLQLFHHAGGFRYHLRRHAPVLLQALTIARPAAIVGVRGYQMLGIRKPLNMSPRCQFPIRYLAGSSVRLAPSAPRQVRHAPMPIRLTAAGERSIRPRWMLNAPSARRPVPRFTSRLPVPNVR
jgi:hypothetical protein